MTRPGGSGYYNCYPLFSLFSLSRPGRSTAAGCCRRRPRHFPCVRCTLLLFGAHRTRIPTHQKTRRTTPKVRRGITENKRGDKRFIYYSLFVTNSTGWKSSGCSAAFEVSLGRFPSFFVQTVSILYLMFSMYELWLEFGFVFA